MFFGRKKNDFDSPFSGIPSQLIVSIVLLIFFTAHRNNASSKGSADLTNYYEQGLDEQNKGNHKQALTIWLEAKDNLTESDFRISHSFIKLVTKEKYKEHYTDASELYFWGLSGQIEQYEKELLLEELEYLKALISNKNYRSYKREIEEGNAEVFTSLKRIWIDIDPTPITEYNERLLEHWERIAYAKENYTRLNSDELDDRGLVYLRFGEPFYNKKGQLNYVSAFVNRLLKEGIQPPSFANNTQVAITTTQRMNLENRVRQYHTYPRYEIWMYRRLTDDPQNIIFMFGTRDGVSSFRKIQSIEDFIPNEAYRIPAQNNYSFVNRSSSGRGQSNDEVSANTFNDATGGVPKVNISPALILQLMYYEQFAALDTYFGQSFDEMMNRFINVSNLGGSNMRGLAREFGTMYGNKLIKIQSQAPNEVSDYKTELSELPSTYYSYRFIDENGFPYIKFFSVTSIEEAAYYDLLKQTNSLETELAGRYQLISGIRLKNKDTDEFETRKHKVVVNSLSDIQNEFVISQIKPLKSIIVSHELHSLSEREDEEISSSTPFPESLKGLYNDEIDVPEPLENEGLVLSDIIVGHSYNEDKERPNVPRDSITFTINHDKVIPKGSELNIYYELYNLTPKGSESIAEYRFEYSITGEKKGIFAQKEDPLISININNAIADDTDKNVIIIDTSGQEEGDYELNIQITDINSGLTYSRVEKFAIR